MAARNPLDKIEVLDSIEKDIITCLQSAGKKSVHFYLFQTQLYFIQISNYRQRSSRARQGQIQFEVC